jgi:hypothetical protein
MAGAFICFGFATCMIAAGQVRLSGRQRAETQRHSSREGGGDGWAAAAGGEESHTCHPVGHVGGIAE